MTLYYGSIAVKIDAANAANAAMFLQDLIEHINSEQPVPRIIVAFEDERGDGTITLVDEEGAYDE